MRISRGWLAGMLASVLLMGVGVGLVVAWTVGVDHYTPAPKVHVQLWPLHPQYTRWT